MGDKLQEIIDSMEQTNSALCKKLLAVQNNLEYAKKALEFYQGGFHITDEESKNKAWWVTFVEKDGSPFYVEMGYVASNALEALRELEGL